MDSLPDTFIPTAPENDDVKITKDYFVLDALNRSFSQISERKQRNGIQGRFIPQAKAAKETLEINGAVLLHNYKVAYAVYHMLREHNLIYEDRGDGYFLVDEQAAYLIVSFIAQRMSNRLGIKTLTGVDISFLLSTACDVYEGVIPDRNALFASAILRFHIPEVISTLESSEYAELRKRYRELRESVPAYLRDLSELYRVDEVRTLAQLRGKIEDIGRSIDVDMTKIRNSRVGEAVRRWIPIGLTSALSIGALFVPESTTALVAALGTVAISVIGGKLNPRPMTGHFEGVRSLLLSAREDIIAQSNRLPLFLNPEPLY